MTVRPQTTEELQVVASQGSATAWRSADVQCIAAEAGIRANVLREAQKTKLKGTLSGRLVDSLFVSAAGHARRIPGRLMEALVRNEDSPKVPKPQAPWRKRRSRKARCSSAKRATQI